MDPLREAYQRMKNDLNSTKEDISYLKNDLEEIKSNLTKILGIVGERVGKKIIKLKEKTFYNESETKRKLSDFILSAEQLSMGPKCKQFEKEFSEFQGRKYSVLFNSGSSANLALIQALLNLGVLKKGDNIGFSALTWSTNIMPLIQLGLNPVPLDISLKNLNVNSEDLLRSKKKLKALFITNLLGFSGDLDRIKKICKERKIILIEDNCESLGSELKGKKLGNYGLASTTSFFVGHQFSTIEGGMVCTDNEELYDALSVVREHGWGRRLSERKREILKQKHNINDFYAPYTFYTLGYNLRPTEITGFLGCAQLKYLDEMVLTRERNFLRFQEVVNLNPDLIKIEVPNMNRISNFAFPLVFRNEELFEKYKKKFSEVAEIRPLVAGSVVEQPFFSSLKKRGENYPNAKQVHKLGFYFPNREDLTESEIKVLLDLLKKDF